MMRLIVVLGMGLALTAPAYGVEPDTVIQAPSAALMNSLATVSGTAADADGTIANVQVRLCDTITFACWDGVSQFDLFLSYMNPEDGWYSATAADGTFDSASEGWTDTVSVNALAGLEGAFVLQARAVDDLADKDTTPATQNLVIDATPPDTAVVTPPHGSSSLATTEIGGTYVDLNISTVQIRVQDLSTGQYWDGGTGFGATEFWSTATIAGPFFTQTFNAVLAAGHTYNIVTKGFDTAGNVQSVFTVGFASTTFTHDVSPPSTGTLTGLFVSSASASWALVPGSTGYSLIASIEAANPPTTVAASSNTSSGIENAAVLTGLAPNTTYYLGVRALGPSTATAYNQFAASATLANPPTGSAAGAATSSALVLSWTANSNPAGTRYEAQADDDAAFGSVNGSSTTAGTAATMSGLTPNTTYHLRVRAVNHGATATAYDASVTTATDAAAPSTLSAVANSSTQITVSWSVNGNPAATSYTAQISTANDFSGTLVSSVTLNASASFSSLSASTTYYARVKATGHGGTATAFSASTYTVTSPGAQIAPPSTGTLTGLFVSSASANWALVSGATGFSLIASIEAANPPTTLAASSATSSGTENAAVLTGLAANTTYYFGVRALGANTASAYTQFAASATLANPPTGTAAGAATSSSLVLSWTANSNPAGTRYEAQADDDAAFGSVNGSSTTAGTTAAISGLTPNTTYHLRVRAVNHGETATGYDTSVTTATDAAAPSTLSAVANSSTQITVSWSANGNPVGTSYTAQVSTASDFSGTLVSSVTLNTSASISSLSASSTYYARVKAMGHGGTATAYSASTHTLTAASAAAPDSISGTVTVNPNQEVNLVQITLSASGLADRTVFSDAGGNWSFTGLSTDPAIKYTIQASWKLSAGDATSIVSQSGHTVGTAGVAVGLGLSVNLGSITGTLSVRGASGAGLAFSASPAQTASGAYVEVYQDRLAARVSADPQGRFTIPRLLPGTYQLRPFNGAEFGASTSVQLAEGQTAEVTFGNTTAVAGGGTLFDPKKFYFYPNPARDRTTIRFETTAAELEAQVFVFDIVGSLVRELTGAEARRSGAEVSWDWDLTNSKGQAVASGIYLVRIKVVDPSTHSEADAIKKLAVVR